MGESSQAAALASALRDTRGAVLFVTGTLAEFALRRTVEKLRPSLPYEARVEVLNIAVAGLMTTEWVGRHLEVPEDVERIVLPGFCRGDLGAVRGARGVEALRGPKDLRDLPASLGQGADGADGEYGDYDIEIIAEINHVPQLEMGAIGEAARRYAADGADVIDLGCDPGGPFAGIGDAVRRLRDDGLRVSVDSMDPREIESAVRAGAELVLSVNRTNIDVARSLGCEVVIIPDRLPSLDGLERSVETLEGWGVPYRIDPVVEPIGFGFAASLGRYIEVRRRFPESPMMMGIGNLTELTGADTAPVNVVLLGFSQELGIRSVLTTEVITWARTSVKECDLARRLVRYACHHRTLPKHVEPALHLLRDEEVHEHGPEVLEELARNIRDRNFRIFAERGEIHVMSREGYWRGTDPFELFDRLHVDDAPHAFYLGYELAKAVTALHLGKSYSQDEALRWGFLTVEEESHLEREKKRGKER